MYVLRNRPVRKARPRRVVPLTPVVVEPEPVEIVEEPEEDPVDLFEGDEPEKPARKPKAADD